MNTAANTAYGIKNKTTKSTLDFCLFPLISTTAISFMYVKAAPTINVHRIISTAALDGRHIYLGLQHFTIRCLSDPHESVTSGPSFDHMMISIMIHVL